VANALHWDLAIPRDKVTAKVDDGVVTLNGSSSGPISAPAPKRWCAGFPASPASRTRSPFALQKTSVSRTGLADAGGGAV